MRYRQLPGEVTLPGFRFAGQHVDAPHGDERLHAPVDRHVGIGQQTVQRDQDERGRCRWPGVVDHFPDRGCGRSDRRRRRLRHRRVVHDFSNPDRRRIGRRVRGRQNAGQDSLQLRQVMRRLAMRLVEIFEAPEISGAVLP